MMKENLIRKIQDFQPCNEQEAADKTLLLNLLAEDRDISRRENLAFHLTASAWVVDPDRSRVLMAYHNLFDSWAWLGGHADGDYDLAAVAQKEAMEESGLRDVRLVSDDILSLEILTVDGHVKKGKYVPGHLHLNCTFLLEADPHAPIRIKKDENSQVGWIDFDDIVNKSTEKWFVERIYSKLVAKSRG